MLINYYLNLLAISPLAFVVFVGAFFCSLLTALILHEVAHGLVAARLGDNTARVMGRLTLDPRSHWDPIGTTMMFIVGFGWAKPVPVNPYNLRRRVTDMALVADVPTFRSLVEDDSSAQLDKKMTAAPTSALNED